MSVAEVQKGLAVSHHATGGRVEHPGNPDGIYGRRSTRSLSSWFRNDPNGRAQTDTGIVLVTDADGRVRNLNLDLGPATMLQGQADGYAAQHRWPIPTAPAAVESAPTPQPWVEGSMELDPEPQLPGLSPSAPAAPGVQVPSEIQLPTLRPAQKPVWPWVAGGLALAAVVGVVVWQARK